MLTHNSINFHLRAHAHHKLKNDETEIYDITITPLCNSPSGMYILIGFSVKTSAGRQIIHKVASFCQLAVLRFSDIHN